LVRPGKVEKQNVSAVYRSHDLEEMGRFAFDSSNTRVPIAVPTKTRSISTPSGKRKEIGAEAVGARPTKKALGRGMRAPPRRNRGGEERAAGIGQDKAAASFVGVIDGHRQDAAPLQRLQSGSERRAVHRQQRRDAADARRLRAIERHQQRELTVRQPERPQRLIEPPRHRPRRALDVKAEASVAHLKGELVGQKIAL
jgi:hypothetical protein